jgi:hypothetical protein
MLGTQRGIGRFHEGTVSLGFAAIDTAFATPGQQQADALFVVSDQLFTAGAIKSSHSPPVMLCLRSINFVSSLPTGRALLHLGNAIAHRLAHLLRHQAGTHMSVRRHPIIGSRHWIAPLDRWIRKALASAAASIWSDIRLEAHPCVPSDCRQGSGFDH